MRICHHIGLEKDFKDLKRFPTPRESLEAWERLFLLKGLNETAGMEQYPGFGHHKIFKARVVPLQENCGKSKGYRVVVEMTEKDVCKILVLSRHGIYKSEQELINLIKNRIDS